MAENLDVNFNVSANTKEVESLSSALDKYTKAVNSLSSAQSQLNKLAAETLKQEKDKKRQYESLQSVFNVLAKGSDSLAASQIAVNTAVRDASGIYKLAKTSLEAFNNFTKASTQSQLQFKNAIELATEAKRKQAADLQKTFGVTPKSPELRSINTNVADPSAIAPQRSSLDRFNAFTKISEKTTEQLTKQADASDLARDKLRLLGTLVEKNNAVRSQAVGSYQRWQESLKKISDESPRLAKSLGIFKEETTKSSKQVQLLNAQLNGMKQASKGAGIGLAALFKGFATGVLAYQVIVRLQHAFIAAVEGARELETAIAEIQTISQRANISTGDWADNLFRLSNAFGLDVLDVAEAQYQALSNQIGTATQTVVFLEQALGFARVTSATSRESVQLLSSALNAFGKDATFTNEAASQLFKTIELGRVRSSELGEQFGNVAILAQQSGVSMEELNTSIATISRQGVRTESTLTLIRQVLLKLVKPTKAMSELFQEWGVDTGEAAVRTFGFQGVLQKLFAEIDKGGTSRLGELTGRVRSLVGVLGLAGSQQLLNRFGEDLNSITDGLDDYDEAQKIVVTDSLAFEKILSRVKNTFIELGDTAVKIGANLGEVVARPLEETATVFDQFVTYWRDWFTGFDLFFEQATELDSITGELFTKSELGLRNFTNTVVANRAVITGTGNVGLGDTQEQTAGDLKDLKTIITLVESYNKVQDEIRKVEKERRKDLEASKKEEQEKLQVVAEESKRLQDQRTAQVTINQTVSQRFDILNDILGTTELTEKSLVSGIKAADAALTNFEKTSKIFGTSNFARVTLQSTNSLIAEVRELQLVTQDAFDARNYKSAQESLNDINGLIASAAKEIETNLVSAQDKLRDLAIRQSDFALERQLDGAEDGADKITILTDRFQELLRESRALAGQGDLLGAEETIKRGDALISQIRTIENEQSKALKELGLAGTDAEQANKLQESSFTALQGLYRSFQNDLENQRKTVQDLFQESLNTQDDLASAQINELDLLDQNAKAQEAILNRRKEITEEYKRAREQIEQIAEQAINLNNFLRNNFRSTINQLINDASFFSATRDIRVSFGELPTSGGRAVGGLLGGPRGRDNQFIKAHSGEFIVNAASTKRFYSQLVAINSGQSPRGYANGGVVTNVGDINIQQAQNEGIDSAVREIGSRIRREVRRRNLRIS